MTPEQNQDMKSAVLEEIEKRDVCMRPKWHYLLRSALIGTGIVAASFALLFVASLVAFALRVNGVLSTPTFGWRGFLLFMGALPWILVLLVLLFVVLLEISVRRYSFAWRQPLMYSALAIIGIAAAGGFVVARTGLHDGFRRYAEEHKFPVAKSMYARYVDARRHGVHPGTVESLEERGFRLRDLCNEDVLVLVSERTKMRRGMKIVVGDDVVAYGKRDEVGVHALGIKKGARGTADKVRPYIRCGE